MRQPLFYENMKGCFEYLSYVFTKIKDWDILVRKVISVVKIFLIEANQVHILEKGYLN